MLKESVGPWPHAIGFFLVLLGLGYLVAHCHRDTASLAAMAIYGCGLLVTFGASALYHWLGEEGPRRNAALRRVDQQSNNNRSPAAVHLLENLPTKQPEAEV